MAETNTNSTVSISLMLMKANLEHKVPVANARIAIKLCRVTFMPTLPADRALACAIRLTNLNNGRSYERDYVLSYSPIDQAYHFPPAMHQKSITELMDILGIACESERNRTGTKQLPSEEGRFLLTKCKLFYPLPLRVSSQWGYR